MIVLYNKSHTMTTFKINVDDEMFREVNVGLKTVEACSGRGKFRSLKKGDTIIWNESLTTEVMRISHYPDIGKMLIVEKVDRVFPALKNVSDGIREYRRHHSIEDDKRFGVIAVQLEVI